MNMHDVRFNTPSGWEAVQSHLRQWLREQADTGRFSGVIQVRAGDQDLLCEAHGEACRPWGIPNTMDTRFRIASIGKMFTAVAVLQLIDQGQLALGTPLAELLDLEGTTIPGQATVRHLLTMTSGMADWCNEASETFEADWERFRRTHPLYFFRSDADYLPVFSHLPPYGPVGERYRYNGAGFMLLGQIIERVSGLRYTEYIKRHVFLPAGMGSTDFLDLDACAAGVAEGYVPNEERGEGVGGWRRNWYDTTAGPAADGGATATAGDLVRFVDALNGGLLLPHRWTQAMTSPQVSLDDPGLPADQAWYGFGCFVWLQPEREPFRWGHTGEEAGVSGRLWHYPRHGTTVVVLGNQSGCAARVAREIQEQLFQP